MKNIILLLFLSLTAFAQENSLELQDLNPNDFNQNFKKYDQATALFAIQLSNLVYLDKGAIDAKVNLLRLMYPEHDIRYQYFQEDIENTPLTLDQVVQQNIDHQSGKKIKKRKKTASELLFFGTKDFVVLVFRGSDSFRDWKTNFRLRKRRLTESPEQKLLYRNMPSGHLGYRDALKNLMDDHHIFDKLDMFISHYTDDVANFPVYTTGHSLGAALAVLCIPPLQYNNEFNYKGTYTFAPALALAKTDTMLYEKDKLVINNIVNFADIVSRKNTKFLTHIGNYYRFSRFDVKFNPIDDSVLYKENQEELKFSALESIRFFRTVLKYHRLDRYIERIKLPVNTTELVNHRILLNIVRQDKNN